MRKNRLTLIVLCATLVWAANVAAERVVVPAKGGLPACQDVLSALPLCGNGVVDSGEQCDQSNLNDQTCAALGFFGGKLQCGASCQFDISGCTNTRFVDNGDGTVTDNQTGLMWEQMAGMAGGTNTGVLNDVNNTYAWAAAWTSLNGVSDGYTITGCFANYCDWRLPSVTEIRMPCAHSKISRSPRSRRPRARSIRRPRSSTRFASGRACGCSSATTAASSRIAGRDRCARGSRSRRCSPRSAPT